MGAKIDPYTFEVIEVPDEGYAFHSENNILYQGATVSSVYLDDTIAKALSKAIVHAKRVCKRDHIKADRIERVNQFLTSLRRELSGDSATGGQILNSLLAKELWHDIGEINPVFPAYRVHVTADSVHKWLHKAKSLINSGAENESIVKDNLEDLERSLAGINIIVQESNRIADEGELVAGKLCKFL